MSVGFPMLKEFTYIAVTVVAVLPAIWFFTGINLFPAIYIAVVLVVAFVGRENIFENVYLVVLYMTMIINPAIYLFDKSKATSFAMAMMLVVLLSTYATPVNNVLTMSVIRSVLTVYMSGVKWSFIASLLVDIAEQWLLQICAIKMLSGRPVTVYGDDVSHWSVQIGQGLRFEISKEENGGVMHIQRVDDHTSRVHSYTFRNIFYVPFISYGVVGTTDKTDNELLQYYDFVIKNTNRRFSWLNNNCQTFAYTFAKEVCVFTFYPTNNIFSVIAIFSVYCIICFNNILRAFGYCAS